MTTPSRKRILVNWLVLLGAVAGLGIALFLYYRAVTAAPEKKKGRGRGFKFTVQTAPVQRGALSPSILLQGDVVSRRTAMVRAEIAGVVKKLPVREGQQIKGGTLLMRLDDRDYVLALRRQQALTVSASAAQQQSRALQEKARDLKARLTKLHRQKIVSDEELTRARLSHQGAKAATAGARGQAALRYAELLAAKRNVDRARLRAPFAGRVAKRLVEVGDRVAVGTPVIQLVGGAGLELHVYVPVTSVNRFLPKTPLRYRLAGSQQGWQKGTIARILPIADPASRNQTVVVTLDKPPKAYAPGLAVEARLSVGRITDSLIVSADALTRLGRQWVVFGVAGGKARRVPVKILGEDGRRVAIRAALKAGEPVVVIGNEALFPNAPVRVVSPRKPAPGRAAQSRAGAAGASKGPR